MKNKVCIECETFIEMNVFNYSVEHFGLPLCRDHQNWLKEKAQESTFETISLYFALRIRGVPAELEKFDGFKTIDIAITDAKVNIEVDGGHHNFNANQALADLKRTYHSFKKGYLTLRIPNSLVTERNIEETADYLTEILSISRERKTWGKYKARS
jgi:very-short-patch-repair endonuclease